MSRQIMTLFFLSFVLSVAKTHVEDSQKRGLIVALEKKLEIKFFEYANNIVKWLEDINYKNLNNSDIGKMLGYNEIKMKVDEIGTEARGMKMMSMALIPIIFHLGITSAWIMLTAFLAAKSVTIGLILLAFKVVVSSVKIASFITALKVKKYHSEFAWPVYHDHHAIHDHHSHIPDYNSHHPHSDFTPYHSHSPDISSHLPHSLDTNTHHPHSSDTNSQQTHSADILSHSYLPDYNSNSHKTDWTSHPTPYKVHPPSLQEIEYVETKKADKRLG
ncbi:uncharacterized protein LOC124541182 [Vanessa cardui]|uniref:uncharacterized protein LOC124541182 n=1 Tax=Vanessa cardui TaxID=171605 RepID=UPI001F129879|nr:uncharacterized protein LOC124541182 [Vanessa cardui]